MTGAPILVVDNLVAGYEPGLPIVNGASIDAEKGEIVAVLGPNGAGKSSLIKAVAGLVQVSAGKSGSMAATSPTCPLIFAFAPASLSRRKRKTYLPQ